ncbi:MAG: hypothetical protein ACRDMV_07695 [Streptosporangiales bacterium]
MSIEAGLLVMVAAFVVVWLVFVVYGEVTIAHDRRRDRAEHRESGGGERA